MNQATLRSATILASVFLLTVLGQRLLAPLDHRVYDWCQRNEHDHGYGNDRFLPSAKMLVYSEGTGPWSSQDTARLTDFLLQSGALATVFHPAKRSELSPPPGDQVLVARGTGKSGDFFPLRDEDGVCRRVALAVREDGAWKPALPLIVFARLVRTPEKDIRFLDSEIQVGHRRLRTDKDYRILVRFRRSSESLTADSLADGSNQLDMFSPIALENLAKDEFRAGYARGFRENAILVGTGFKEADASIPTPLGPLPDFKIHACALETLVGDLQVQELTTPQNLALCLASTVLAYGVFVRLPFLGTVVVWGLIQVGWLLLSLRFFSLAIFLGYTPVLLSTTSMALAISVTRLRQASTALLRYGGLGAYEAATRGDETVFEEVREKTATIVFTNVLSYLKEMERYGSPNDFFERRQAYAQLLSDVFRKHGGVILDYQGDFQMVGFNVELRIDDPDHALHAVAACHDFLARVPALTRTWWEAEDSEIGTAHCGICTGPVACGHVGSRRHDGGRIAQAAIGDTSNVAARLLGAAMKQKEPILMSMTTVQAANGKLPYDELEPIPLKGKTEVVPVARPKRAAP